MKRFLILPLVFCFAILSGCIQVNVEPEPEEEAIPVTESVPAEEGAEAAEDLINDEEDAKDVVSDESCTDLTVYPVDVNDIHILGGKYGINLPADVHYKQLYKYYKQCDQYYALARRENSNINLGISNDFDFTGLLVLNDSQLDDKKWEKYIKVRDLAVSNISPNPHNIAVDFWGGGQGLFLAAVDQYGAGSGEGVMKILSSADFGQPWNVSGCYYYNPDALCSGGGLQCTAIAGNLDELDEYSYNSDTGQFELTQFNKMTGEMEVTPNPDCRNAGAEYVQ